MFKRLVYIQIKEVKRATGEESEEDVRARALSAVSTSSRTESMRASATFPKGKEY